MSQTSPERNDSRRLLFRVLARSLSVKRPQAALAMTSLAIGAAILSMLVTLYGDVHRKMTQEFRAYGPNILLTPPLTLKPLSPGERADRAAMREGLGGLMDEAVLTRFEPFRLRRSNLRAVGRLYAVVRLKRLSSDGRSPESLNAVAAGVDFVALRLLYPSWQVEGAAGEGPASCVVGSSIVSRLHLKIGDGLEFEPQGALPGLRMGAGQPCKISAVVSTGASEDEQVFLPLEALQKLTGLEGKISVVEISVPGEPAEINQAIREVSDSFSGLDVRPVREIVYSEGKVLGTIRWLMISLTGLILVTAALSVAATVMAIVIERRRDIAVMKALGASNRAVMQLFLAEAAGLGLAGGAAGSLVGGFLAGRIGERLFATSLHWVGWTLPVVCLFSMFLAGLAAAFPVQFVRAIQPATMLKGE